MRKSPWAQYIHVSPLAEAVGVALAVHAQNGEAVAALVGDAEIGDGTVAIEIHDSESGDRR